MATRGAIGFNTTLVQLKDYELAVRKIVREFQYHTGSIKSMTGLSESKLQAHVSIPHWFN